MRPVILTLLAAATAVSPLTAAPTATPSPRAVVEATFAAINAHDAVALAALYAPDAVSISSDTCKPSIGPEAVRIGHEALVKAMPDLRVEPTDWIVDGDRVAVLFTAHSKGLGPSGMARFGDFFTVRNGKVVRDETIFNPGEPCH